LRHGVQHAVQIERLQRIHIPHQVVQQMHIKNRRPTTNLQLVEVVEFGTAMAPSPADITATDISVCHNFHCCSSRTTDKHAWTDELSQMPYRHFDWSGHRRASALESASLLFSSKSEICSPLTTVFKCTCHWYESRILYSQKAGVSVRYMLIDSNLINFITIKLAIIRHNIKTTRVIS